MCYPQRLNQCKHQPLPVHARFPAQEKPCLQYPLACTVLSDAAAEFEVDCVTCSAYRLPFSTV